MVKHRLILACYALLWYLLTPLILLRLLWRSRKQAAYRQHWPERWAIYPHGQARGPLSPMIWIHAVSVGETRAAEPLILALLRNNPEHHILLTGMTPTGRQAGLACFGHGSPCAGRVHQVYLPYDYPGAVRRFLRHFRPQYGLLMETELWPNLMSGCRENSIPIALVNARLSPRSARGYQRFAPLTGPAFRQLAATAAQSPDDAQRLMQLGAFPVTVCGNLKFDVRPDPAKITLGAEWKTACGQRPIWLAASTRAGEEQSLLAAHQQIRQTCPDALLILVPRHPQRFAEVAALVSQAGLSLTSRSQSLPDSDCAVWLGDSMGEMAAYFTLADIAAIGGSWQPLGGQNLIEAAACTCPIIVGPHTFNFAQATEDAISIGAAIRLPGSENLAATLLDFWRDPAQQARMRTATLSFTARYQGATARILDVLTELIDSRKDSRA